MGFGRVGVVIVGEWGRGGDGVRNMQPVNPVLHKVTHMVNMVKASRAIDESYCHFKDRMHTVSEIFWGSMQKTVTIINP